MTCWLFITPRADFPPHLIDYYAKMLIGQGDLLHVAGALKPSVRITMSSTEKFPEHVEDWVPRTNWRPGLAWATIIFHDKLDERLTYLWERFENTGHLYGVVLPGGKFAPGPLCTSHASARIVEEQVRLSDFGTVGIPFTRKASVWHFPEWTPLEARDKMTRRLSEDRPYRGWISFKPGSLWPTCPLACCFAWDGELVSNLRELARVWLAESIALPCPPDWGSVRGDLDQRFTVVLQPSLL